MARHLHWIALALSTALFCAAAGWLVDRHAQAAATAAAEPGRGRDASTADAEGAARGRGFGSELPPRPDVEALVAALHAAAAPGVVLASVTSTVAEGSESRLGRADLVAVMHGSYGELRRTWSQVLDDRPGLALRRLTLRREAGSRDDGRAPDRLEATLSMSLLGRPPLARRTEPT